MTLQQVPTFANPFYTETVTLDGVVFVLDFQYNQRASTWYLSVSSSDGAVLASGIALVPAWDLLAKVLTSVGVPPGVLIVFTRGTDDTPPSLLELGADLRASLVYGATT